MSKLPVDFVPLGAVAKNAIELIELTLAQRVPKADKRDGTIDALIAGIRLAELLYYTEDIPSWDGEKVKLSLIKETKAYGNTSVSMGLAVARNPPVRCMVKFVIIFGCLNCGTGDVKQQYYLVDQSGVKRVFLEYKPKGGVNVQGADKLTDTARAELQQKLAGELNDGRKLVADKLAKEGYPEEFIRFTSETPLAVFVTGTLRNERDEATPERRAELDASMDKVFSFNDVVFVNAPRPRVERWSEAPTYFMPQDVEGTLEFKALEAMHANLEEAKEIPAGSSVVLGLGIGRGTSQVPIRTAEGKIDVFGFPYGMNDADMLGALPHAAISWLKTIPIAQSDSPVVSFKSGALLMLENNKEFRANFLAILHRSD